MKNDVVRRVPRAAESAVRTRGGLRTALRGNLRSWLSALVLAALFSGCAASDGTEQLRIEDGWVRPVPLMSGLSEGETADVNSAAYMVLRNPSGEADRLIGATTTAARAVELHLSSLDDGIMRMRQVDAIEVPAQGEVRLEPGGYHLMLIGVTEPLEEGGEVAVNLHFDRAGEVTVRVPIAQR